MNIYLGCAGWQIGRERERFGAGESILARYATRFNAVEINSTFRSEHRAATFERWHDTVPHDFRFAVKAPHIITHVKRLEDCSEQVEHFVDSIAALREKLGPILVQLPPSLHFDRHVASPFFHQLRRRIATPIVCEPRHESWGASDAEILFTDLRIARAAVDPEPFAETAEPSGTDEIEYFRLHGSPHTYHSSYSPDFLSGLAERLVRRPDVERWCIFDNTAEGAAVTNSMTLAEMLGAQQERTAA